MDKNEKISKSMEGNTNAEKWTFERASKLMNDAVELSKSESFDFIGEVAKKLDTYIDVFDYICDKFPELKKQKNKLKRNCETNCFSNIKNENINVGAGIMNLKSNHGWTDRVQSDVNQKTETVETQFVVSDKNTADEIKDFIEELKQDKD
jgi:hypothetical protein